jgi:hypothetical protein
MVDKKVDMKAEKTVEYLEYHLVAMMAVYLAEK